MSKRLLKSTFAFGSMTMISRVLGLIRDVVIARYFGAGLGTDAFFIAFKIPNYLRRLFAEGAFSQAFVPVLSEYKTQRDIDEVRQLVNAVTGTLGTILGIVTLIGVLAAPVVIMIFAPGFLEDEHKYNLAVGMLRVTFPYLLFISLTALAGGILNTYGRFAIPAFTPAFLNIALIICAVWLAPLMTEPITALAWGVFVAGIVQLFFQFPFLARLNLFPRPVLQRGHEGVRRIIRLMVPILFAVSVSQINLIIDMLIASFLRTGSITWLYYSDRLMEFPLGVFGVALATVMLPNLSEKHASGTSDGFGHMLGWALRWAIVIGLPASLGLIMLAKPILVTIFEYGEFDAFDVEMASRSLIAYAVGLTGFILIKVLASGYFSRQDTKTPVKIGVVAMFANIILNLILVFPLAHAGLALATSIAAFINAGLLFLFLHRKQVYRLAPDWWKFFSRVLLAVTIMSLVLFYFVPAVDHWLAWAVYDRALQLFMFIIMGAVTYLAVLGLSGLRPRHMLLEKENN